MSFAEPPPPDWEYDSVFFNVVSVLVVAVIVLIIAACNSL